MKYLFLPMVLLFSVIMANGELEEFSTTVKTTEEKLNNVDSYTIKYNEIESLSTTTDKVSDTGSIVPMEHAPCEDICFSTLNCSEWNHCAYHHPDHCLGLQLVCIDDDEIKTADEDTTTETSSCSSCFSSNGGSTLLCVLELTAFLLLVLLGVHALFNFLLDDDEDEPMETKPKSVLGTKMIKESVKCLNSWKDDKKPIVLENGKVPITMIV